MREIKFRAWDKECQEMTEVNRIDYEGNFIVSEPNVSVSTRCDLLTMQSVVMMQYTSLKNKNGVDIYDKDIVLHSDYDNSYIGIVEWADWGWYINGIDPKDSFDFADVSDNGVCELEILGNVYEDPELLKTCDSSEE